jgi:hypothetical protein
MEFCMLVMGSGKCEGKGKGNGRGYDGMRMSDALAWRCGRGREFLPRHRDIDSAPPGKTFLRISIHF